MDLEQLSGAECLALIGSRSVGRIGLSVDALPTILPVDYALADDQILIRTGAGAKLCTATSGVVVAFEVDDLDPSTGTGWSVVVRGLARETTDSTAFVERGMAHGWIDPSGCRHFTLSIDLIAGRQVLDVAQPSVGGQPPT